MRLFVLVLLGIVLAACRPPALTGASPAPGGRLAAHAVGQARATIRIRWPVRATQGIPSATERIVVSVRALESVTAAQALTLFRPSTATDSVASFEHLAPGPTIFSAEAKDDSDRVLAAGSATVTLLANQVVPVRLVLGSTDSPVITGVAPTTGVPGDFVSLVGSGFGATSGSSYSVSVGDLPVPGSGITRVNDSLLVIQVPGVGPAAKVSVKVDGKVAESAQLFTPIASLSITPTASETYAPFGIIQFGATAYDSAGAVIPNPTLYWQAAVSACDTPSCFPGKIESTGTFVASEEEEGYGSMIVQVGRGAVAATATVRTHAIGPSDVPGNLGVAGPVLVPAGNPQTAAKVALGKRLFFDPGLSSTKAMSCASCHLPDQGFSVARATPLGNDAQPLPRNAPTVLDVGRLASPFFWDGRAATLEDQAIAVFDSPRELAMSASAVAAYLGASSEYVASFSAVFGAAPSRELAAKAIASFQRSLVTDTSPFERWMAGDDEALTDDAEAGLGLFLGKGNCVACHSGPMLSDDQFHNVAIPGSGTTDQGRRDVTGLLSDAGRFRTPPLRHVTLTAPYFHDGSKATLRDAIVHYEQFDKQFPNVDPLMPRVVFTAEELHQLEAFMHAVGGATPSF